jgi:plasmid maintenance system antidote protein VapI
MEHPGLILDKLRKGNDTIGELATKCELAHSIVSSLCHGKIAFTLRIARVVERAGYGKAATWMELQAKYDELHPREKYKRTRPISRS